MLEDYEKRKKKQLSLMRALLDYGMGIAIVAIGVFFFFRNRFDMSFNAVYPPNNMDKIFGIICIAYGGWRIYRGYRKNYFK